MRLTSFSQTLLQVNVYKDLVETLHVVVWGSHQDNVGDEVERPNPAGGGGLRQ